MNLTPTPPCPSSSYSWMGSEPYWLFGFQVLILTTGDNQLQVMGLEVWTVSSVLLETELIVLLPTARTLQHVHQ